MAKELKVLSKAKKLVNHTFDLTNNTKRYPKKIRFTITNRIQEKVIKIVENILRANLYSLKSKREYIKRRTKQKEVIILCKELLFFIEMSKERKYINSKSHRYWSEKVVEIKYMVGAWINADKKRFK